jgi:hypothetical protein
VSSINCEPETRYTRSGYIPHGPPRPATVSQITEGTVTHHAVRSLALVKSGPRMPARTHLRAPSVGGAEVVVVVAQLGTARFLIILSYSLVT